MEQNEIEDVGNKLAAAMSGAPKDEEALIKIPEIKKPEQKKEEEPKNKDEPKKSAKSEINLDEISKLLGVK